MLPPLAGAIGDAELERLRAAGAAAAWAYRYYAPRAYAVDPLVDRVLPDGGALAMLVRELEKRARWPCARLFRLVFALFLPDDSVESSQRKAVSLSLSLSLDARGWASSEARTNFWERAVSRRARLKRTHHRHSCFKIGNTIPGARSSLVLFPRPASPFFFLPSLTIRPRGILSLSSKHTHRPQCEMELQEPHHYLTKQFCGAVPAKTEVAQYRKKIARTRDQAERASLERGIHMYERGDVY